MLLLVYSIYIRNIILQGSSNKKTLLIGVTQGCIGFRGVFLPSFGRRGLVLASKGGRFWPKP